MEEKDNNIPELSEQEVWSIIEFARSAYNPYGTQFLTPDLINARMRDINLNPMIANQDQLEMAMKDPKSSEKQLQAFSQSFELTSMVYKRLIAYLSNMLSFDITYTATNAKPTDYTTPRFKKDLETVEGYLDKFDYKKEFRSVVREMLRNDAYFGVIRETDNKILLQELPPEYCKITGRWEGGFVFSFNMYWFLQAGIDLDMYPKFFKQKFKELWGDFNSVRTYNPHLPPEERSQSTWIYWVDVPVDIGVCFKLTPELATRLPYFTPLFNDLVLQGLMRNLQKNINMSTANRMLIGEVPLMNKETKATVKDSISISPDLLGKFLGLVKSAISESIKVAAAPLENLKGVSFDSENEVYESYLRTALASSGINTNLIFSGNIKPNAIETQLSLNVDEQLMTSLYSQFDEYMTYYINKLTKSFRFAFEFEGTDFYTNRSKRLEDAMTLFGQGIILPQKIAAAIGMKPSSFMRQMEMSSALGFADKLVFPLQQMQMESQQEMMQINQQTQMKVQQQNQQAKTKGPNGRPQKKDSELSDSGLETRDAGSNIDKGGKI